MFPQICYEQQTFANETVRNISQPELSQTFNVMWNERNSLYAKTSHFELLT